MSQLTATLPEDERI